ncbi:MAG TPA: chemotaxis protein [Cerasibacillus sp.]|uniref:chemotaxis protein n=1 Tax=Cerasibacillus sp. TaxID=2498711 RepID=UPI002F3FC2EB
MTNKSNILLESGTNELEIIMFEVGEGVYGINVLKVREIINPLPITHIPNSPENVEGVIRLREEVLPVINLADVLNVPASADPTKDKFIITELNQVKIAFRVHHVSRIHRISWEQIEKPSELSTGQQAYAIGIIKLEETMPILLDFEKIIIDITPEAGINIDTLKELGPRERSQKRIVAAEDSAVLRELLKDTLAKAGYEQVRFFENGKDAWEYLESLAEDDNVNPVDKVQLVITDIEMPQMDGHHLTKRIKSDSRLSDIPVIVFSSLITGDLYHKGKQVGASSQVSKPQIVELVQEVDKFIL